MNEKLKNKHLDTFSIKFMFLIFPSYVNYDILMFH